MSGKFDFYLSIAHDKGLCALVKRCNDKPIITVCDNTVFVRILPELAAYLNDAERGFPYDGAKLHYILDIEDSELLSAVIPILEAVTPLPKPRKRK